MKQNIFFLPVPQLYWLHWSFHFCFESASFVWVTLPQAQAEQLACVVKLLMGTREDMRMSREPPPLLFVFLYLILERCGTKVACHWECMLHIADDIFTFSETWCVHTFTFTSYGANSPVLFGLCFQLIWITLCLLAAVNQSSDVRWCDEPIVGLKVYFRKALE